MKLSVIIPVYNEEKTIIEILNKIKKININKEIIVVNDYSTDNSYEILSKIKDIKLINHQKNMGKSAAIRTSLKYVTGDIVIIQDADLEYNPEDYYKLVKPIEQKKTKIVYGTRFPKEKRHPSLLNPYYLGNKVLTIMANVLYNAKITDEPTCYKVFDAKLFKSLNLKSKRFGFCPEVTAKIRKKGFKIYEVPISYNPRTIKEGKKINWKDGIEAVWILIKYRFMN